MTYDEMVVLIGFYPGITVDQWHGMSTCQKLHRLAEETGIRNKRWLRLAVRQDQVVKACSEKQRPNQFNPFMLGFCSGMAVALFWIIFMAVVSR